MTKTLQVNDNSRSLFDLNYSKHKLIVSGSDEVGRGAMAGPVVVASVILPFDYSNPMIKDSKILSLKQRENLFEEIVKNAIDYRIVFIENDMVDKLNPKASSVKGMLETIDRLNPQPSICLIDGEKIKKTNHRYVQLIKGDNKSQSIAAASILAKVTRDRLMKEYGKLYPQYGFEKHVGYCTKAHQIATKEYGVLPIHRKSYAPIKRILKEFKK